MLKYRVKQIQTKQEYGDTERKSYFEKQQLYAMLPDGKIIDSKWIKNTGDDLQTAAEAAIAQLTKTRNANPDPVPTHLLSLTTKWLCFKFSVQSP